MDLVLLSGIALALLIVLITLLLLQKKNKSETKSQQEERAGVPQRVQDGIPRRAQIARNQRNRLRQGATTAAAAAAALDNAVAQSDISDEEGNEIPQGAVLDEKMGTKKRAKLEAKEQKRAMREQELREREKRKEKEAKMEEERKQQEKKEEIAQMQQLEAERRAREEKERKEHEEYLKMKAAFSIEEEGFEEGDEANKDEMLTNFIQYIKNNKVVLLEDLASEFKMKTQQAIERLQELQANGTLTGVIDDRGKFIYISEEELSAVAKFIKQRGRVSIADLAESSNQLINLKPVVKTE